jgi:hypothetical protein
MNPVTGIPYSKSLATLICLREGLPRGHEGAKFHEGFGF